MAPSAPSNVVASVVNYNTVYLTWSAPPESVDHYVVSVLENNNLTSNVTVEDSTSYTLSGLTPTSAYCFTVAAVNSSGTGPTNTSKLIIPINNDKTAVFFYDASSSSIPVIVTQSTMSEHFDRVFTDTSYNLPVSLNTIATNKYTTLLCQRVAAASAVADGSLNMHILQALANRRTPFYVESTTGLAIKGIEMLSGTSLSNYIISSGLTTVGTLDNLNVTGGVNVANNTLCIDASTGWVGIGTTTKPLYPLDVSGNVNAAGYTLKGTTVMSGSSLVNTITQSSLTSVGNLNSLSILRNAYFGGTQLLVVDSSNTCVGICKTPTYPLDVSGNISSSGYSIKGTQVLTTDTLGSTVLSSSLSSLGTLTNLSVTGNLTVGTQKLVVNSSTKSVGIGKTPTTYPLDVSGNINTSTGYRCGGVAVLSDTTLGASVVNSSLTNVDTLDSLNVKGLVNSTTIAVSNTTTVNEINEFTEIFKGEGLCYVQPCLYQLNSNTVEFGRQSTGQNIFEPCTLDNIDYGGWYTIEMWLPIFQDTRTKTADSHYVSIEMKQGIGTANFYCSLQVEQPSTSLNSDNPRVWGINGKSSPLIRFPTTTSVPNTKVYCLAKLIGSIQISDAGDFTVSLRNSAWEKTNASIYQTYYSIGAGAWLKIWPMYLQNGGWTLN